MTRETQDAFLGPDPDEEEDRPDGDLIITNHVYPPIPDRRFDWSAVRDGYEPGNPIGWGRTEKEAIADLLQQEDERDEA